MLLPFVRTKGNPKAAGWDKMAKPPLRCA